MPKMNSKVRILSALLLAGTVTLTGCASTGSSSSNAAVNSRTARAETESNRNVSSYVQRSRAFVTRTGEVYMMRGLANIFSRGIDRMAERLRARGVDAVDFNHADWRPIAEDVVRRSKSGQVSYPIVIMGHSLGGNAAPEMANYLAQNGVKVEYVVAFDPTLPRTVGPNIKRVVNFYLPHDEDNTIHAGAGFKGELKNINVSGVPGIKHTNVEKNPRFQADVIERVMSITKEIKKPRKKRA